MKRQVFYSFHYDNDVFRVQQIRNIGAIEDNAPVAPNAWEEVRRKGDAAVQKWIDDNMKYRSCVVVLVGQATANRPLVKYEIKKAWEDRKGLVGIHIHNLKCPNHGICAKGANPFEQFNFPPNSRGFFGRRKLSDVVKCYDPGSDFGEQLSEISPYQSIRNNLEKWVEEAIVIREKLTWPFALHVVENRFLLDLNRSI